MDEKSECEMHKRMIYTGTSIIVVLSFLVCFFTACSNSKDAFLTAIDNGDLAKVKLFIEKDPSLLKKRFKDRQGADALVIAIDNGHKDVVEYLLDSGADPNGTFTIKSADYDIEIVTTPLCKACANFRTDLAKLLLEHGADLQWEDESKNSVIIHAARLLKLYSFSYNGETKGDAEEFYRFLLDNGANPNDSNVDGNTPLHFIVKHTYDYPKLVEVVDLFLARGADPFKKNNEGVTPYDNAQSWMNKDYENYETTVKTIMSHMEKYR